MPPLLASHYLQIETWLLLPFLLMLVLTQLRRSSEAVHSLGNARAEAMKRLLLFTALAVMSIGALHSVSFLLGVELAIGLTLALLHPVNALCFFVYMLFLRPWDLMPGNPVLALLPRLLAGTCFFSWLFHPWQHGKLNTRSIRSLVVLLAFSLWLFLSTFISPHVTETQADWFNTYFKSLIVFVMCSFFIEDRRSVSEFKNTILLSVFSMAVLGLFQYGEASQERLSALSMLDPNDLAAISIIAVPLALTLVFSRVRTAPQRLLGALFFVVSLLAIWYSRSRGALIALAAQVAGFHILVNVTRKRATAVLMVGVMVLGYFLVIGNLQRRQDDLEASSASRLAYWKAAVRMAVRNPLLGVGFEQYPEKYESYSPSLKYEWGKRTAHSTWLLAFAESGMVGGALFLFFFLGIFRTAWRRRAQAPDQLCALGGYGIAMTFLSHTYLLFPYLLYGLILASDSVEERIQHDA